MMKILRSSLMAAMLIAATVVTDASARGHSTDPELYFLEIDDAANSLLLLPPPPQPGTPAWEWDKAQYEWGKSLRDTPRGAQAVDDCNLSGDNLAETFSPGMGIEISREATPAIYDLILNMREDLGELATRHAKEHYMRPRPFIVFGEDTCNPDHQAELSTNGSYPSGHTAVGWGIALVLAEINPACQDAILKRGYEMGQSRVICGYHFQSDVDAGRLVASAMVARLHADKGFAKKLDKARKEFRKVSRGSRQGR